jgi:hypothetical protein
MKREVGEMERSNLMQPGAGTRAAAAPSAPVHASSPPRYRNAIREQNTALINPVPTVLSQVNASCWTEPWLGLGTQPGPVIRRLYACSLSSRTRCQR